MEDLLYKSQKKWGKKLIFFGFLLIYSFLLLWICKEINISEDEAYTLNTTSYTLPGVMSQSYHFEGQPPLYFILLSLWRRLYPGIFFAKLFSLLFIGLSAYVFYRVVLLISGIKCAYWMVIIFLLNPFTVWAALEMRTYSLLIFLSTILIYFFFRFFLENNNKYLYLFLVTAIIGTYTQYFFTLLIIALVCSIWVFRGWKTFLRLCLYLIPVVLLFLPNLLFVPDQIAMHEINETKYSSLFKISEVFKTSQNVLLAIKIVPFSVWLNRGIRVVFILFAISTYIKLYKKKDSDYRSDFRRINYILLSLGILITLYSIVVIITGIGYADKYMVTAFPLFILLFTLFKVYSTFGRRFFYCTLSIYYLLLLIGNYRHPVKTYDYKSVAAYINKIGHPDEPILFYRSAIALPFKYYYKGKNEIVPLPYPVKFDTSYLFNIKDTFELEQSLKNIKSTSNSYLLVSDTTTYESTLNMNREMVDKYINNNYNVTLDTLFYGWSKIRPLRIKRFEKIDPLTRNSGKISY